MRDITIFVKHTPEYIIRKGWEVIDAYYTYEDAKIKIEKLKKQDKKGNYKLVVKDGKKNGKKLSERIMSYLEIFVSKNNDLKKLDKLLKIDENIDVLFSDVEETEDYQKDKVMKQRCEYVEPNYENGIEYPKYLSISNGDYKDLIAYNPNIVENNQILGMKLIVRGRKK
ncbi:MAG: hypothetical protein HFH45_03490 [Bacilli bacterium]|nr:hypothetical protein [Bacilli bacterium]